MNAFVNMYERIKSGMIVVGEDHMLLMSFIKYNRIDFTFTSYQRDFALKKTDQIANGSSLLGQLPELQRRHKLSTKKQLNTDLEDKIAFF